MHRPSGKLGNSQISSDHCHVILRPCQDLLLKWDHTQMLSQQMKIVRAVRRGFASNWQRPYQLNGLTYKSKSGQKMNQCSVNFLTCLRTISRTVASYDTYIHGSTWVRVCTHDQSNQALQVASNHSSQRIMPHWQELSWNSDTPVKSPLHPSFIRAALPDRGSAGSGWAWRGDRSPWQLAPVGRCTTSQGVLWTSRHCLFSGWQAWGGVAVHWRRVWEMETPGISPLRNIRRMRQWISENSYNGHIRIIHMYKPVYVGTA